MIGLALLAGGLDGGGKSEAHSTPTLRRVSTLSALEKELSDLSLRFVLVDSGLRLMSRPTLLERLEHSGVQLVLRLEVQRCPMQELASICARLPRTVMVLKSSTSHFSEVVASLLSHREYDPGPIAWAFGRIAVRDDDLARILLASLALGRRRATVDELSAELGIGKRALQSRLNGVGFPPHRFLVWA